MNCKYCGKLMGLYPKGEWAYFTCDCGATFDPYNGQWEE